VPLAKSRMPASGMPASGVVGADMVGVGTLMPVPRLLTERGIDPARTLAEFGLDLAYLKNPENTIAFATMARIESRCAELTQCPHFGLLIGQCDSSSSLGTLGFLMRSAPDVRTAIDDVTRHFRVHNASAEMALVEVGDLASVSYRILPASVVGSEHVLDCAMALTFKVMQRLCGPEWRPVEVRLGHTRPPNVAPYRGLFGAPLRFDESETALFFARDWLDRKLDDADPIMHLMMAQRVGDLESHVDEGLANQMRRTLPELVATRGASLAAVAQLVGVEPRTLNRRLAAEGSSFMQLRDDAVRSIACQLLEHTQMPIGEIADRLGYANPSAFNRAFHRWEGPGPAQWRASRSRRASSKHPDIGGGSTQSDRPRAGRAVRTTRPK
jgi:AraC-like DNA-binding protein